MSFGMFDFWRQTWTGDLTQQFWPLNANGGATLRAVQAKHDLLVDEAQNLVERRCQRQQDAMHSFVTLTTRLQSESAPAGTLSAWLGWGRAGMDRMVDDAGDQMHFAGKVAQCCLDAMTAPLLVARESESKDASGANERSDHERAPSSRSLRSDEQPRRADAA